jgi:hypothetical protein
MTVDTDLLRVADALGMVLKEVPGLRVHAYLPDTFTPPGIVVGQPTVDFANPDAAFCWAVWDYPLTLVVARSSDRVAQQDLLNHLRGVVSALRANPTLSGNARTSQVTTATPGTVEVNGTALPMYSIAVSVYA